MVGGDCKSDYCLFTKKTDLINLRDKRSIRELSRLGQISQLPLVLQSQ